MFAYAKLVSNMPNWPVAVNGHLLCGQTNMETMPRNKDLTVACWNVRTILDKANSSRSDRRSTLMAEIYYRY